MLNKVYKFLIEDVITDERKMHIRSVTEEAEEILKNAAKQSASFSRDQADKVRNSRLSQRIRNSKVVTKVDNFITKDQVVKAASAMLGFETAVGAISATVSATAMLALGHPLVAIYIIVMYLIGAFTRLVVARNAVGGHNAV